MTAFPAFFNDRVRRDSFQRRIQDGLRRDRLGSGAIGQVRRWNGERLTEKAATDLNDSDYAAWRKFLSDIDGGYFDYTVPDTIGTGTERVVRARIVAGSLRESVRQWGGAWRRVECMLEYRNAARVWTPTSAYADYNPAVLGVWGTPVLVGDALKNQHAGADAAGDLTKSAGREVAQNTDGSIDVTDNAENNSRKMNLPRITAAENETICVLMYMYFNDDEDGYGYDLDDPFFYFFGESLRKHTSVSFFGGNLIWTANTQAWANGQHYVGIMIRREGAATRKTWGLYADSDTTVVGADDDEVATNDSISSLILPSSNYGISIGKWGADNVAAAEGNIKDVLAIKFQRDADDNHITPAKVGDMLTARSGNSARSLYGVAEVKE